jgi:hypothetical protein
MNNSSPTEGESGKHRQRIVENEKANEAVGATGAMENNPMFLSVIKARAAARVDRIKRGLSVVDPEVRFFSSTAMQRLVRQGFADTLRTITGHR